MAQTGLSGRIYAGAEGINIVVALALQRTVVAPEQGEHQSLLRFQDTKPDHGDPNETYDNNTENQQTKEMEICAHDNGGSSRSNNGKEQKQHGHTVLFIGE